jgi:hypothetical protein
MSSRWRCYEQPFRRTVTRAGLRSGRVQIATIWIAIRILRTASASAVIAVVPSHHLVLWGTRVSKYATILANTVVYGKVVVVCLLVNVVFAYHVVPVSTNHRVCSFDGSVGLVRRTGVRVGDSVDATGVATVTTPEVALVVPRLDMRFAPTLCSGIALRIVLLAVVVGVV